MTTDWRCCSVNAAALWFSSPSYPVQEEGERNIEVIKFLGVSKRKSPPFCLFFIGGWPYILTSSRKSWKWWIVVWNRSVDEQHLHCSEGNISSCNTSPLFPYGYLFSYRVNKTELNLKTSWVGFGWGCGLFLAWEGLFVAPALHCGRNSKLWGHSIVYSSMS